VYLLLSFESEVDVETFGITFGFALDEAVEQALHSVEQAVMGVDYEELGVLHVLVESWSKLENYVEGDWSLATTSKLENYLASHHRLLKLFNKADIRDEGMHLNTGGGTQEASPVRLRRSASPRYEEKSCKDALSTAKDDLSSGKTDVKNAKAAVADQEKQLGESKKTESHKEQALGNANENLAAFKYLYEREQAAPEPAAEAAEPAPAEA